MNTQNTLAGAIAECRLVEFTYHGGVRVVEPHMLALNETGQLVLSAWFVRGYSRRGGHGWREYLLSGISLPTVLNETFDEPRSGYNPEPNAKFPQVIARV